MSDPKLNNSAENCAQLKTLTPVKSAQSLAEVLAAVRASKLSDADKERTCHLLILIETPAERMTPDQLREAREVCGLSLGQAARLLQVPRAILLEIEAGVPHGGGVGCWPRGLCDRMNDVYRLGPAAEGLS